MTTEHTPPPWVEDGFFLSDEYGDFPGIIGGNGDTVCYIASFAEQPDLNLIKAAPDLLAALDRLVAGMDASYDKVEQSGLYSGRPTDIDGGPISQARAAIAKAKGESQ